MIVLKQLGLTREQINQSFQKLKIVETRFSMEQYDKVPTRLVVNPINDYSLKKAIEAAIKSNSAFRYKGVTYNKHSVIK